MDETLLREKVGQLLSEVRRLPPLEQAGGRGDAPALAGHAPSMKREMAALEESLDHVRLAIKYLVFDLEATKRENRLLREMLGDQ